MAHHQHHGGHMEAPRLDKSIASQPTSTGMPSISEDELAGEADEPPERRSQQAFTKTAPPPYIRRPSLLTKALHTDTESHSESHDESLGFSSFNRQASRSSTCSTWSGKSDLTSDDGLASNMSSPTNKPTGLTASTIFHQPEYSEGKIGSSNSGTTSPGNSREGQLEDSAHAGSDPAARAASPKPAVEDTFGRKRCISFACGRKETTPEEKKAAPATSAEATVDEKIEVKKRPCMLKFACPSKISWKGLDKDHQAAKSTKHDSPPPPTQRRLKSPSPAPSKGRPHRDSDATIRNESPKTSRKVPPKAQLTVPEDREPDRVDSNTFHEFASADEPVEEWVQESTCHRSRLTVQDTLKKENDIRQIGEEAEEEALEEEDEEFDAASDGLDSDEDDISDDGFHSDDEDGFAESDDDSEGDSDYEWWAPRRSSGLATMAPADGLRPPPMRSNSDSSLNSITSPKYRDTPKRKSKGKPKSKTEALPIRPATPELPDSTDFVCGTLDEDRPLEQAYASCLEQRKAAKHIARPQDIDPTFPTDMSASDEEDEVDDAPFVVHGGKDHHTEADLMHGSLDDMHGEEEPRGRRPSVVTQRATHKSPARPTLTRRMTSPPPTGVGRKRSPAVASGVTKRLKSPPPPTISKRLKSPPPPTSKRLKSPAPHSTTKSHKSPAPFHHNLTSTTTSTTNDTQKSTTITRGRTLRSTPLSRPLFGHSPRRMHTPPSGKRLTSPPPSRRGSPPGFTPQTMTFGTAFLGHRPQLTHTSSLPRAPNPLARRHGHLPLTRRNPITAAAPFDDDPDSGDDIDSTPHDGLSIASTNTIKATADSEEPTDNDDDAAESEEITVDEDADDDDDDEASSNDTAREAATPTASTYTRGAIDIVQGLERKRLRRRMKFHEKYCRKEERKLRSGGNGKDGKDGEGGPGGGRAKRPIPGRGAERMRQVGIECALYRGKRVLSV